MGKLQELTKEKILVRSANPIRSTVLGLLIDSVQKTAKTQLREVKDEDFATAAKKMKNELQAAVEEYKKGNGDTSKLLAEIAVISEFVPAALGEDETKIAIEGIISGLPVDSRNLKTIMPLLKQIENIDMKLAKTLVESLI